MLCQSGGDPESCYIVRKRGLDRDLEEVELGGQGPRGRFYKMGGCWKAKGAVGGMCLWVWTFNLKQRPEKGAKWG